MTKNCLLWIGSIIFLSVSFTCDGCGFSKTLASESDIVTIKSPNFPNDYPSNAKCKWTVSAPLSSTTHKTLVVESVTIETEGCCDKLQIGYYYPVAGILTTPLKWTSFGSDMTINFRSDDSSNRKGFHLTVKAVKEPPTCVGGIHITDEMARGVFEMPNVTVSRTSITDCTWFMVSEKSSVDLIVEEISMKKLNRTSNHCDGAVLDIYNPKGDISRLCNDTVDYVAKRGHGKVFGIHFRYSGTVVPGSFKFQYIVCGFTTTFTKEDDEVLITSPRFPNAYPNYCDCDYKLSSVQRENLVRFTNSVHTCAESLIIWRCRPIPNRSVMDLIPDGDKCDIIYKSQQHKFWKCM